MRLEELHCTKSATLCKEEWATFTSSHSSLNPHDSLTRFESGTSRLSSHFWLFITLVKIPIYPWKCFYSAIKVLKKTPKNVNGYIPTVLLCIQFQLNSNLILLKTQGEVENIFKKKNLQCHHVDKVAGNLACHNWLCAVNALVWHQNICWPPIVDMIMVDTNKNKVAAATEGVFSGCEWAVSPSHWGEDNCNEIPCQCCQRSCAHSKQFIRQLDITSDSKHPWNVNTSGQGRWPPSPETGSAGDFFLFKRSFPLHCHLVHAQDRGLNQRAICWFPLLGNF